MTSSYISREILSLWRGTGKPCHVTSTSEYAVLSRACPARPCPGCSMCGKTRGRTHYPRTFHAYQIMQQLYINRLLQITAMCRQKLLRDISDSVTDCDQFRSMSSVGESESFSDKWRSRDLAGTWSSYPIVCYYCRKIMREIVSWNICLIWLLQPRDPSRNDSMFVQNSPYH